MESHSGEKEALVLRCGGAGKTWRYSRSHESTPDYDDDEHEARSRPTHEYTSSCPINYLTPLLNDNNNLIKIKTDTTT